MNASKQITDTEIFVFIAVLVFKLLSCKILFINRKDNRNYFNYLFKISRETLEQCLCSFSIVDFEQVFAYMVEICL